VKRIVFFLYGVFSHLLFFGVFAYLAGFLGNMVVPKTLNGPALPGSVGSALAIDLALLLAFALQHSVMARPAFKRVWTRFVPTPIERSTYVLIANLLTMLLIWQWRPIPIVIWNVTHPIGWWALTGLFIVGLLGVPAVSLMINHFDLFGTRQVWLHLRGEEYTPLPFRTPLAYAVVRHPLYVGWALAFWATPTMTAGHLLFAAFMTGYMGLATLWEERDLIEHFGEQYHAYRRRVPRFLPALLPHPVKEAPAASQPELVESAT
jgi:protein-S-isoprenylcysteine O-methyltransferase Ste14